MIKILIMDVDGTLTDGKIFIGIDGEVMKGFNVKDGLGINKLESNGILPVILTGRFSGITEFRARELGIKEVYQGKHTKLPVVKMVAEKYECSSKEIAYIGDDENDLIAMDWCGITGCPADAVKRVRDKVDYISSKNGGEGAVREFIEYLLESK